MLAGEVRDPDNHDGQNLALARFLPDGRLDPSFGEDGLARTKIRPDQSSIGLQALSKGDLVVVGPDTPSGLGQEGAVGFRLARLSADGNPRRWFGRRGAFALDTRAADGYMSLGVSDEDRILVAGAADSGRRLYAISPRGELDRSFSGEGSAPLEAASGHPVSPRVIAPLDGSVLAAGQASFPRFGVAAFGALLLRSNGDRSACREARQDKRKLQRQERRAKRRVKRAERKLQRRGGRAKRLERKLERSERRLRKRARKLRQARAKKRALC